MPSNHHIAAIRPVLKRLIKGEETSNQTETHEQHEDGSLVMLRWHNSARHDAETGQTAILSVIEDISAQETQQQRLAYQATHDALTGLANRVLLKERVNFVINDSERHHESAAIVLLDLDRFKLINDSLGHMTGDDLLCEAARRLTQLMRSHDTLGRLGGDEFLLILPGSQSSRRIEHLLNRILESFREPIEIDGRLHHVKISAGVSFYPQHSRDADTLIRQADMAMYAAKSSGGNCFRVFDAEMEQETQQRLSVENDLRTAIKDQQLELYLQPLVMTSDTGLWGAEALIRWNHPSHGLVLPNDFIPYAEESSLILEIGEFVMDQAHRIAGDWAKRGLDQLKICINLSARQFSEDALTSQLMALQETYACSPRQIILELTESTLLEAVQNNIERLNLIKALGYQLALDDFGTGYSSINHLSRFPIDILKIDRGFIDRSTHNETARALVSSMIQMGQRLKLQVIAEGVETREQMMMLKTEQCDLLQGFLFGKPIPIPQFEAQHIRQRRHAAHKPNRRIANL